MSSRKSKIIVDEKESTRVLKVAEEMFAIDGSQPERNIFMSLQNIIHHSPAIVADRIIIADVMKKKIETAENISLDTASVDINKDANVSQFSNVHTQVDKNDSVSKQSIVLEEILASKSDGQLMEESECVRRSKRKRVPKLKSDEPYKRKKIGEDVGGSNSKNNELKSTDSDNSQCDSGISIAGSLEQDFDTSATESMDTLNVSLNSSIVDTFDADITVSIKNDKQSLTEDTPAIGKNSDDKPSTPAQNVDPVKTVVSTENIEIISPSKSDFVKLGPTISCFKCGSIFETRYAIIFTQRFYCCRECLPAETTREMRLGTIIKQCHASVGSRDRSKRRCPKNYALIDSMADVSQTPSSDGKGNVNRKCLQHKSISSCPSTTKKLNIKCQKQVRKSIDNDISLSPKTSVKDEVFLPSIPDRHEKPTKREKMKCPLKACDGKGHISGKYPTHRSLYGCPLAARLTKESAGTNKCPNPECDSSGSRESDKTKHSTLASCPRLKDRNDEVSMTYCKKKGDWQKNSIKSCADDINAERTCNDTKIKSSSPVNRSSDVSNVAQTEEKMISILQGETTKEYPVLQKEVSLLTLNNNVTKELIPKLKCQLRQIESSSASATQHIDSLLIEEYQANSELREKRTKIEQAINLACIPVSFSDIPYTDQRTFFERLKNYFNDRHTSIYREKLKTALNNLQSRR